jgi:hypothetical protein
MQKTWLIKYALLAMFAVVSGNAIAAAVSDEEMQSIKQYCDEMNAFGSFASEEERMQAVNSCISEEVSRSSENSNPDESGNMEIPE